MDVPYLQAITEALIALLRERKSVVIPDFGAFSGLYESAVVDHLSGVVLPPSLKVTFNPDLRTNDGVLMSYLTEEAGWAAEEVEQRLADFVRQALEALQQRHIVEFPGLGKLYLDFDRAYRFVQESENLNKDAFGLPAVSTPIVRAPEKKGKEVPVTAAGLTEVSAPSSSSGFATSQKGQSFSRTVSTRAWWQHSWLWVLFMSLIILLVSGYFLSKRFASDRDSVASNEGLSESQAKESLRQETDEADLGEGEYFFGDDPEDEEDMLDRDSSLVEADSEAPTLPPDTREAVIVVGSFSKPRNAERLIQHLYEDGYEAYSDRRAGRTRVGIRFAYSSEAELMEYLEEMKNKYNVDAWILE